MNTGPVFKHVIGGNGCTITFEPAGRVNVVHLGIPGFCPRRHGGLHFLLEPAVEQPHGKNVSLGVSLPQRRHELDITFLKQLRGYFGVNIVRT